MSRGKYHIMVYIAMLAAQGLVIALLERLIPSPFAFAPGAKLGLANLVTIIAIFTLPLKQSAQVVILRTVLTMLIGGTFSTFLYSFAGAVFSYLIMILLKNLGPDKVSIIGISVMGGIAHNIGQLSMAALLAKTWAIMNYLPVLSLSGLLAGFAVGLVGNFLLHRINILRIYHQQMANSSKHQSWLNQ